MSLRTRFAVAFALIGAVVALLVGALSYHAASNRVTDEIDRSLASTTLSLASGHTEVLAPTAAVGPDGARGEDPDDPDDRHEERQRLVGDAVAPNGTVTSLGGRPVAIPLSDTGLSLAQPGAAGRTAVEQVDVGPDTYRVLTTALGGTRGALRVAVDVDSTEIELHGMAIEIAAVSVAVLVAAAGAGWFLARRITRRLVRLAAIAEDVSADGRMDQQVPVDGRDEVGRLSTSFNTMLVRLAASRQAQERLVQDAAHELRTPLTSLRTNATVLRRVSELSPEARERLIADVEGETRELSHLVEELVELALSQRGSETEDAVDLAAVATDAARRVQRRSGRAVRIDSDGSVIRGRRQALERAVGNLLENAAKFDSDGTEPLQVAILSGAVTVIDGGPGISATDADRVFDRFYRADAARGLPGSGLGLAIVRDVAETHGGEAFTSTPAAGGAAVGFRVADARLLPSSDPDHVGTSPPPVTVGNS